MKQLNIFFTLLIISSFFSCQDSDRDEDNSTNSSADYATGQSIATDIFKVIHQSALSSRGITTMNLIDTNSIFGCDTLIVDTLSNPKRVTIQFNNLCNNRSGEINATFSTKYDLPGCVINISLNNYSQNLFSITSNSISIINNGLINSQSNYSYSINQLKIEDNRLRNITWSGNQTIINTNGDTTSSFSDDTFTLSGIANGRTFQGNRFNATIVSNLMFSGNCNWIPSGVVDVSPENRVPRKLNFGNECDNKAIVSVFDINYDIAF